MQIFSHMQFYANLNWIFHMHHLYVCLFVCVSYLFICEPNLSFYFFIFILFFIFIFVLFGCYCHVIPVYERTHNITLMHNIQHIHLHTPTAENIDKKSYIKTKEKRKSNKE